eukprot:m.1177391 g.1177391  ORF g.1177391 m.1177391 type:complete len:118 (-) comp24524_c0_seq10:1106-1459(-)
MHHVPQQSSPAGGVPTQREKERIGQLGDWAAVPGEFPSPLSSRGSYSPPRERLGLRRRVRYSKNPNATTPSKMPADRSQFDLIQFHTALAFSACYWTTMQHVTVRGALVVRLTAMSP